MISFKRLISAPFLVVFVLSLSFILLHTTTPVFAAVDGEKYTWLDAETIQASGANIHDSNFVNTGGDTGNLSFTGEFHVHDAPTFWWHSSFDCYIPATLALSPPYTSGKIKRATGTPHAGGNQDCKTIDSSSFGYYNASFTVAGTRPLLADIQVRVNFSIVVTKDQAPTAQLGPLAIGLYQGSDQAINSSSTNSWKGADFPSGSPDKKTFTGTLIAPLVGNIPAGTYTTCIITIPLCTDFVMTDVETRPKVVNITLDGDAAINAAGLTTPDQNSPKCEDNGGPLGYALCSIFNMSAGMVDWILTNFIQPFLKGTPVDLSAKSATYQMWSGFRMYGNILLVIALAVIVISQAFGGGLVDAYTARKAAPRLLLAAILVNLSIYIVALGVDVSNVVGSSIGDLILAPLKASGNLNFSLSGGDQGFLALTAFTGVGGILGFGSILAAGTAFGTATIWILLFVLLPVMVAILGMLFTVVMVQALTLVLIITSPFAYALYATPFGEKYFSIWWDWYFRVLLVYPIVMIAFALSDVMTVMVLKANGVN